MVDSDIFYLKYECDEIQRSIQMEKQKLLNYQAELEDIAHNDDILLEQAQIRKRDIEINTQKTKLQELLSECKALDKLITVMEKEQIDMNPPAVTDMKSSLNKILMDIELADDEMYQLEDKIKKAKEENVWLEKNLKNSLASFRASIEAKTEQNLLDLRKEEEEARFVMEQLTVDLKKTKQQLLSVKHQLAIMQTQCKDKEKENNDIIFDIEQFSRLKEKMKKEEEEITRGLASSKAN